MVSLKSVQQVKCEKILHEESLMFDKNDTSHPFSEDVWSAHICNRKY